MMPTGDCIQSAADNLTEKILTKVPEVTLGFWIIKILATTLGETGGDTVSMSMGLGYLVGSLIFGIALVLLVAVQIRVQSFRPFVYWATIIASTTAGTTLADFADRSLGIGYAGGSTLLLLCVVSSLATWHWVEGSISISTVFKPRVEIFYWITITFSQTLGTALGDWTADSGFGYDGGAVIFATALGALAVLYFRTKVSHVFLFWTAFILTRPLGATVGDFLDKPISQGGLDVSRPLASLLLATLVTILIVILPQRAGAHPGETR